MKQINTYINEKLIINKDVKILSTFSKDEYIFVMSLKQWDRELEWRIYNPFKCINFDGNKIKYKTSIGKVVEQEIFLNSNDYYELKLRNDYIAVFLKVDDGLKFLESYRDNLFTAKNALLKYFDENDKEFISRKNINPYFSINVDLPNFIKEYKKLK